MAINHHVQLSTRGAGHINMVSLVTMTNARVTALIMQDSTTRVPELSQSRLSTLVLQDDVEGMDDACRAETVDSNRQAQAGGLSLGMLSRRYRR